GSEVLRTVWGCSGTNTPQLVAPDFKGSKVNARIVGDSGRRGLDQRSPEDIVCGEGPADLDEMLARVASWHPDWHARAACAGEPIELFFPGRGESLQPAFELCGRCTVR